MRHGSSQDSRAIDQHRGVALSTAGILLSGSAQDEPKPDCQAEGDRRREEPHAAGHASGAVEEQSGRSEDDAHEEHCECQRLRLRKGADGIPAPVDARQRPEQPLKKGRSSACCQEADQQGVLEGPFRAQKADCQDGRNPDEGIARGVEQQPCAAGRVDDIHECVAPEACGRASLSLG